MKSLLALLEDALVFVIKHIILTGRYMKRHILRIACYILAISIISSSYFIGANRIEADYQEESTAQTIAKAEADVLLQDALTAKEEKRLAAELAARLEAERIEAERIEAARVEAERVEAERKEAARKEAARVAAEKEKQKKREEAAKAEALRKEVVAAEKAKAAAEKAERTRISWQIKAQENNALAEQAEYEAMMPTPIVNLGISNIFQKPELPNGCEVTALATLLGYKGQPIDKTYLADKYLPKFPFYATGANDDRAGGDPNFYFAGDPRKNSNAYYCFAGPLVEAANKFLLEQGSPLTAYDITGSDEQALISQLDSGNPVVAWGTLSMGDAFTFKPNAWIINDRGEKHVPFLNLHCVVLYGYDDVFFYIADPLRGNVAYKRSTFMNAYRQIGSRAVIVV